MSGGALPARVVNGVVPVQDQLGDGNKLVPLLEQGLDDGRQGFRGVEGGIVEQHDGPGLDLGGDPLSDLLCRQILPVQAIPAGKGFKRSARNQLSFFEAVAGILPPHIHIPWDGKGIST